jgi:Tfp pilus assembly protein PilO
MKLKSREKILIVFVVIAIAIWAFDFFYYTPQTRKIQGLKAEAKTADLKLKESLLVTVGVETLEAEVRRLEGELNRLSERTLKGEEFRTFLRHLARESDSLQMKVISLNPQEEKLPLPEGKKEVSGSQYRRINIQMVLHSTYTKLGTYLKGIEELPFLISVDSLHVEKNEEVQPLLKVTIGLSMYVAGEEKGFKVSRIQGFKGSSEAKEIKKSSNLLRNS